MKEKGKVNMETGFEEKPLNEVTLLEIERLCKETFELDDKIKALEDQIKVWQEAATEKKKVLIEHLTSFNKHNYESAYGKIIVQRRTSSKIENKDALFSYLKGKGIFENMATVHSQTLNSYCKQEIEAAIEDGKIDFKVPGVSMTDYQTLSLRRK